MGQGFGRSRSNTLAGQNKKKLIAILCSLVVCCSVAILIIAFKGRGQASASNNADELSRGGATVLVSETGLTVGQDLSKAVTKEVLWPSGELPAGAVRDRGDLGGMFAKVDVPAGSPILRSHLSQTPPVQSLPVTPGNRAVTIEVDSVSGINGLVDPGSRVDVVLTYSPKGELVTNIIVQNARVLASDGRTKVGPGGEPIIGTGSQSKVKTVTLDVSTKDALTIQTSSQLGRLSLLMRSGGDSKIATQTQISQAQIGDPNNRPDEPVVDASSPGCKKGYVRMGGKDYQMSCDGTIHRVEQGDAP